MKIPVLLLLGFLTLCTSVSSQVTATEVHQAQLPVANVELDWFDDSRQRPVKVTIWYPLGQPPLGQPCQTTPGQVAAQLCLHPATDLSQTALFSHGAMGAAKGYRWIGELLAAQGIVTVGLNHYGESWVYGPEHIRHSTVLQFNLRPEDARFVLDQLELRQQDATAPLFSQALNWHNLTAVGHSSGAATMLALAGARFELTKALAYCQTAAAATDRSCGYIPAKAVLAKLQVAAAQDFQDHRVKRVIALDPALGHLVEAASLARINQPVLVVGSVQNDFLPYAAHAGFYAGQLVQVSKIELTQGEGHFVYLDSCQHQHQALGVSLCQDRPGVERKKVQQQLAPRLLQFIAATQGAADAGNQAIPTLK